MPSTIEITLNIIWIPVLCLISALAGFLLRSNQLNRANRKVFELEKQSVNTDAEILSLHKEISVLQDQLKNNSAPVIPIKPKESNEELPDASSRKKLLSKSTAKQ